MKEALIVLWEAADRICGKRLKALLPQLVDSMERHKHPSICNWNRRSGTSCWPWARQPSIVSSVRSESSRAGDEKNETRSTAFARRFRSAHFGDWGEVGPGYLEVDFVSHCGERAEGSFVHTLVLTDVASGWTECIALPVREQALVVEAITGLRRRLPFTLRGLDTDNDTAFLNETILTYCNDHRIVFTRSRPYQKNDQGWVEQKNGRSSAS